MACGLEEWTSLEASKCPKCGDEPFFIEQVEKWYCYGCNTYIEDESQHANDEKATAIAEELKALDEEPKAECKNCGAELEGLKDGRLYCFMCETYQDELEPEKEATGELNEAQKLLESAVPVSEKPKEPELPVIISEAKAVPPPISIPVELPKEPAPKLEAPAKIEPPHEVKMCSTCGQPLKFIEKYSRHYCYGCRKYAPKDEPAKAPEAPKPQASDKKKCPDCGSDLKYIEKYTEHYCYSCKKYPLRAQKKVQQDKPHPPKPVVLACPTCGDPLKWIEKYGRHYCYKCKEYAPKGFGGVAHNSGEKKACPDCGEPMKFIPEYNEWYCYKCKKYPMRPSKPVLLL